jgi:hypothetical protein
LWVFKFFFGFLSSRRSAWNNALHSFHSALGNIDAPFFGAPQKQKTRKKTEKHTIFRSAERRVRALLWGVWGGG